MNRNKILTSLNISYSYANYQIPLILPRVSFESRVI